MQQLRSGKTHPKLGERFDDFVEGALGPRLAVDLDQFSECWAVDPALDELMGLVWLRRAL